MMEDVLSHGNMSEMLINVRRPPPHGHAHLVIQTNQPLEDNLRLIFKIVQLLERNPVEKLVAFHEQSLHLNPRQVASPQQPSDHHVLS
jgi:hypothetical protein